MHRGTHRWLGVGLALWATHGLAAGDAASPAALAGTQWRLVEFQSMDDAQGVARPSEGTVYSMWLHGDGTVTMQLNCNRATGSWSAEPGGEAASGRFQFGPLEATRALCPPPSMDESIVAQSSYVRSYLLKDDRLYLSLMADAGIYVWARETDASSTLDVAAAPESGGPRNWEVVGTLNLREQPSTSARILATYRPGTILDNLGCQRAQGRAWCDVQKLGGGPRGYVAAQYLRPAISPDGSAAMGPDDSALRAGQGRFDASGPLPCAFAADQPMGQCEFGVARAGGGYATVVIKKPDGRSRAVFFRMGRPIGADVAESEGRLEFTATKEGDLHRIRVGDERYEIPDAVVLGGLRPDSISAHGGLCDPVACDAFAPVRPQRFSSAASWIVNGCCAPSCSSCWRRARHTAGATSSCTTSRPPVWSCSRH